MKQLQRNRIYRKRIEMALILALTCLLFLSWVGRNIDLKAYPKPFVEPYRGVRPPTPKTGNKRPASPPRPTVPIPSDDPELPPEVTIDPTIGFGSGLELPQAPRMTEPVYEFFAVEQKPFLIGGSASVSRHLVYPESARKLHIEGRVIVRVLVGADGHPKQTHILQTSGYQPLDQAAEAAIMQTRWHPGYQREQPVAVWVAVPVVFRLH